VIVVLTGAPGAGKGTQGDLISERLGYRKVSTGDVLRKHIKQGTEVGKIAEAIIAEGKLVSDEILLKLIQTELSEDLNESILLDGYPRNPAQAKDLESLADLHTVKIALHLDVDKDELIERLSGRLLCKRCGRSYHRKLNPPLESGCESCGSTEFVQREDDSPDKISVRLDVYNNETAPMLDFYKKKNLYQKVDGTGDSEEVFQRIEAILQGVS